MNRPQCPEPGEKRVREERECDPERDDYACGDGRESNCRIRQAGYGSHGGQAAENVEHRVAHPGRAGVGEASCEPDASKTLASTMQAANVCAFTTPLSACAAASSRLSRCLMV